MNWLNFFTYAYITTITPGPNNLISLSNGGRYGIKKSLPFNAGVWTGVATIMIFSMIFCHTLEKYIPTIKKPMAIAGAAYLLYLAWKIFKNKSDFESKSRDCTYTSGVVLQFLNPKIIIYAIVSMETYVIPVYGTNVVALILMSVLLATVSSSCNIMWLVFGSFFKTLFSKYRTVTNTIMSLLLVYCVVTILLGVLK